MSYNATSGRVALYKDGVSLTLTQAPVPVPRPSMITPRVAKCYLGKSQYAVDPYFGE